MQLYKIECIIGKRVYENQLQYLVKWRNYKVHSWLHIGSLCNQLAYVNDYEFAVMNKEVELVDGVGGDDFEIVLDLEEPGIPELEVRKRVRFEEFD